MGIYLDALTACHRVGKGGDFTHTEKRNILAVVRAGAGSPSQAAVDTAVLSGAVTATDATAAAGLSTIQAAAIVTQFAILDAFTGGSAAADIVAAIAVAKTALYVPSATLDTAVQLVNADGVISYPDLVTAAASVKETLIVNPVMDGY